MSRVNVRELALILEDKARTLESYYRRHSQPLTGIDAIRIKAWRRMARKLRRLRQRTISEEKANKMMWDIVAKEFHIDPRYVFDWGL